MNIEITVQQWKKMGESSTEMISYWKNFFSKAMNEGLTEEEMQKYSPNQITLMAYLMLREEMLEGGLVQLIYNGYGPFIFLNPFAKAIRQWGMKDFSNFIYSMRKLYEAQRSALEGKELSDEDFMALYELHPELESSDDDFIEMEPSISQEISNFVFQNPTMFGIVVKP